MAKRKKRKSAVFILTHGRPSRVHTINALRRHGYTGPIYLIVDDEDPTVDEYRSNYADEVEQVIVFSKAKYLGTFDLGDNHTSRSTVTFARNASWDIARELGLDEIVMLDDDYNEFTFSFDGDLVAQISWPVHSLNELFTATFDYLEEAPQLTAVAWAQRGEFIGGPAETYLLRTVGTRRKIMNTFFLRMDRRFEWKFRLNDDVTTYCVNQRDGSHLFLTIVHLAVNQLQTQTNKGGLTEMYSQFGTYAKSFYTTMACPAEVHVTEMGRREYRLHHFIDWKRMCPVVIREDLRKR